MGIRGRFMAIVGVLTSVAIIVIGAASYKFSTGNALDEAKAKGEIIFNYIKASRDFFRNEQRALVLELVEKDRFYPELMSGFVVTRATWDRFKENMPGYIFKQATIDPLYPPNKADADELEIIRGFQNNPELKKSEGIITKDGKDYLYLALPVKVGKKGCLRCHGDPLDAPKDQIEIYGTENGYNWEMNDTVASYVVYVPIAEALANAKKSAAVLVGIGAGTLLLTLLGIGAFLGRSVVTPIVNLSQRAEDISLGKNLDENIEHGAKDEIGNLAQAVNRLRISVQKMLQRMGGG